MHHFDDATRHMADIVLGYALERLRDPAPLDHPVPYAELAAQAGQTITSDGIGVDEALRIFVDVLAPACISTDSTRFFSFIPAAPTKAALLFDTVVGASSFSGTSWLEAAGAVYAENQALRFIADLAGLPAEAGGTFVSGGSAGNLSALVVARDTAAVTRGKRPARWRVAVGEQAHSSIASTLRIIDADPLFVPSDDRDRFTGPNLRRALEADPDPSSVCAVVATAGTTNAGIIDDLPGLAAVAHERGLWFHVDAAYGGAAMCAPSVRTRFRGIEGADSFVVDPHKWLFAPFDCAALLYREPELARRVHAQQASYLEAIHEGDEWNPSDYAYHLSRRSRGLPFWFSLAVHGTQAYRDAVEQTLATAREAADRIRALPHVDLVREPALSIVLFRRSGWDEADYLAWSHRILMDHTAFCLPTRWKGEMVARACFLNPLTTPAIVDELLDSMA